jgi:hypothetical protein
MNFKEMKKQFTIFLLFLFSSTYICAQNWIKTNGPCNDEILKNVAGEWIHWGDPWYAKVSKQHEQEIRNRVQLIHQFIYNLLPPSLPGIDAAWGIHSADYDFAQQSTIEHVTPDQKRQKFYNGVPLVQYTYSIGFFEYSCGKYGDPNFMRKGYPREDGASLTVAVNTLNKFLNRDYGGTDGMQIDGRNIKMRPPVIGTWKGYTMYDTDYGDFLILLHRDGILPYIPVTRKQYLELAINYFNKFYDNMLAELDKSVKVAADMGIKRDPADKEKWEKQKKEVVKYYEDALTNATTKGLLDTPAIVMGFLNPLTNYPIFISEADGGYMLVTENPKYFRKDLPKYVPQLFMFSISKMKWWFTPKIDPIKILEEKFPIEKLQAMIDK